MVHQQVTYEARTESLRALHICTSMLGCVWGTKCVEKYSSQEFYFFVCIFLRVTRVGRSLHFLCVRVRQTGPRSLWLSPAHPR